jgi:hypothetical protein
MSMKYSSYVKKLLPITLMLLLSIEVLFAYQYEGIVRFNDQLSYSEINEDYIIDVANVADLTLVIERELFGDKRNPQAKETEYSKITFSAGTSNDIFNRELTHTNGTDTLSYNLYKDSTKAALLKSLDYYTDLSDVLFYEFPSVTVAHEDVVIQRHTHEYVAVLAEDQFVPAGTYTDLIEADLFLNWNKDAPDADPQQPELDSLDLNFTVEVLPFLGLSLTASSTFVAASESYSMPFGNIEDNESRSVQVVAKSNVPYPVTASSEHNGHIKHELSTELIPYVMSFDGDPVDLSNSSSIPVELVSYPDMTPSTGNAYPMTISFGSVEGYESGNYQDSISFEITAN